MNNTPDYIMNFIKAICPEAPDLYLASFNEKQALIDATEMLRTAGSEREKTIREAQHAVVNDCTACDGRGFTVTTTTGYGHVCGGDEKLCQTSCPVPIPEQSQEQCEYCGRPCQAISALLTSPAQVTGNEREKAIREVLALPRFVVYSDMQPIAIFVKDIEALLTNPAQNQIKVENK
jgi:hypothetical protein